MAKAVNYLEDVKRYDPGAPERTVEAIVKHLGASLKNKDAALVACSDSKEKDHIAKSWVEGKLGLSGDTERLVDDVCKQMENDAHKQRVTFYYLLAMHTGKLGDL